MNELSAVITESTCVLTSPLFSYALSVRTLTLPVSVIGTTVSYTLFLVFASSTISVMTLAGSTSSRSLSTQMNGKKFRVTVWFRGVENGPLTEVIGHTSI